MEFVARKTAGGAQHGVNLEHRCDISRCRFVLNQCPLKYGGRPARIAVCASSLHIHWCGTNVCRLAQTQGAEDAPWVCPISGLEVTGQAELYCPQRVRKRGSRPDVFSHSLNTAQRKPAAKKCKVAETRRLLSILLTSPDSEALVSAASTRRMRAIPSAVSQAGPAFMDQMIAARLASPRFALPHVSEAIIADLALAIDDFIARVKPRLGVCKGNASQVAAVVGFLATGVNADGVVIFPKLHWVTSRLPAAADLGKLPGFQCRPVSISARHIKAAVFGSNGKPIATLLFRWPRTAFNKSSNGINAGPACGPASGAVSHPRGFVAA